MKAYHKVADEIGGKPGAASLKKKDVFLYLAYMVLETESGEDMCGRRTPAKGSPYTVL
jgi:hypothetical protein